MPDKKTLKPHDMRTKQAKEKLYGTVANRNAIHGISKPVKSQDSIQQVDTSIKKEGEKSG